MKPLTISAGITPLAFVPPSIPVKQSDWPTLGELIDSGKRVVVFMDAGADGIAVPFILPEFPMVHTLRPHPHPRSNTQLRLIPPTTH